MTVETETNPAVGTVMVLRSDALGMTGDPLSTLSAEQQGPPW